jgi:hypothetical protein
VGERTIGLLPPVVFAVDRYMNWRHQHYGGPSRYLLVNQANRLRDRPVGDTWFQYNLLNGIAVASLRQSGIQQLVQALGCDGLQLAAYTRLSLGAIGIYIKTFGRRPPSVEAPSTRPSRSAMAWN